MRTRGRGESIVGIVRLVALLSFALLTLAMPLTKAHAALGPNVISNGSLETGTSVPTGWYALKGAASNVMTSTYPLSGAFDGARAARINVTTYTSGDAFWSPPNAPVTAGKQYTFTGYTRSSVSVPVIATYLNSSGSAVSYATLGTRAASTAWSPFTATVTIPSGVTQVRIQHVLRAVGQLDIDAYSLQEVLASTSTPARPVINSFSANPTSIAQGSSTLLSWSVTGATSLSISPGVGTVTGTSRSVSPTATTTYILSATNAGGTSTSSVTVAVRPSATPARPVINSFSANPTIVTQGSSTLLSWSVTGATSLSISPGIGAVTGTSRSVTPTATTTYILTATNAGGSSTSSVTVAVRPSATPARPVINSFSANPTIVTQGSSTLLSWSVTGATSLSINQGVGTVTGTSRSVTPTATTTYILSATNAGGTSTSSVTVAVRIPVTPPPPGELILNGSLEAGTTGINAPQHWNQDYWGTLTPAFTYGSVGVGGSKGVEVRVTGYQSGDAKWYPEQITVSPSEMYKYTAQYQSDVSTSISIEYQLTDGSYRYEWVSQQPASPSIWSTYTLYLTIPDNTARITMLHGLSSNGVLRLDNISMVAMPATPFPQGMVTMVFDDGLSSQYANALPILNAAGLKGSFSIITQAVGGASYMNWAQIQGLPSQGHEVGAHTRTHADLTAISPSAANTEIVGSRNDLLAKGLTPNSFVYPYGSVNDSIANMVRDAGFTIARGSYWGMNAPFSKKYELTDVRVDQSSSLAYLQGIITQAVRDKRWVVLELHDVLATGGDAYSTTPAFFQQLVTYLKDNNISVVTLEEGAQLMQ